MADGSHLKNTRNVITSQNIDSLTDLHGIWYADAFCLPNRENVSECKPEVNSTWRRRPYWIKLFWSHLRRAMRYEARYGRIFLQKQQILMQKTLSVSPMLRPIMSETSKTAKIILVLYWGFGCNRSHIRSMVQYSTKLIKFFALITLL